jgi:hypothetical protein
MSIWSESAYHYRIRGPKGVGRGRLIEAIANAMDKDIVRLDLRDCRVPGYLDGRIDKDQSKAL